jgi:AsmA-like C-terminal region/AsmA family
MLSALFAAPLFIDWNDYRPAFETQARNLLGRDVKVDGQVHLVLLPAPELRFDDVKVADREGRLDTPFLEARSFEAWLNIGALLSGTIEARKIAIVDPVLRLDVNADGTGNWSDVGRKGVALPFAPKDVMLDEVGISGGRIEITREGASKFVVEQVEGEASAQSLSGPYKVSASYLYNGRPQELRFSTSAPDAVGVFRIKSALRDVERNTSYVLDGGVSGLGATPLYDGTILVRAASVLPGNDAQEETDPADESQTSAAARRDKGLLYELKGPLKATPERAELPDFDLTIHTKGHPQIFTGRLSFDLGEELEARGELAAGFVDLDALFAAPGAKDRPSPAAVLYIFAEDMLEAATEFGEGALTVTVEQASLGGDLLSAVELALTSRDGALTIDRLKAVLPGANRIETTGRLTRGEFGPVFAGPVKLEGSGLQPLTRWAAGSRDVSGQASLGDFTFTANARVGDGALDLADAEGELSGTKFRGALRMQGGERRLVEIKLDSDRLDLRELMGDGPFLGAWLPSSAPDRTADDSEQSYLAGLRGDDMRVTLRVGELLLPNIPSGKLDARFALQQDALEVDRLDFAAADSLSLNGKGRIDGLSQVPSGRVDFALSAADTDSLRVVADLFGFSEDVRKSEHLSVLAPLDLHVSLTAAKKGEATQAAIELGGKAGGSDVTLRASAVGDPAKPEAAAVDIKGKVTGDRPQAFLVLLFPELPVERLAATGQSQGTLSLKFAGIPNQKVTGKAALETEAIGIALRGQGSLKENGVAFAGKGALVSPDAALALMLAGFESPPSAAGVPMQLRFDISKQGPVLELGGITGSIDDETVTGSARFDFAGVKSRFALDASAGTVLLPSLLGVLVAWQRTPSTEEMLGAVGAGASELWPSRGFALGPIETAEGEIALRAETLSLGSAVKVADATLHASVGKDGLSVTDLKGHLFGGALTASGTLAPRGNGAELEVKAEISGGKLEDLAKHVAGASLAKGPFDLAFNLQGEGLSPPGLVAGLSGEGNLALGAGALQSLSPEPLRRVAATAAKKTIKADREEIAAEAGAVRETITKGTYKYAPVQFAFEVKNGTLRLTPAVLAGPGAATTVNGYLELASLKLDSEWTVSLAGKNHDVPPVNLVFTGALNQASEISPSVDTAAIEAYLTMRRMQEDVERLETLDVSGATQPEIEAEDEQTAAVPLESAGLDPEAEPEPVLPMAEAALEPLPQAPRPKVKLPSAMELLGEEEEEIEAVVPPSMTPEPSAALPAEPAPAPAVVPETSAALPATPVEPESLPEAQFQAEPDSIAIPSEPAAAAAETAPAAAEPKPAARPAKRRAQKRKEAPDDWKKGISIFGGGY